ncbi:unnamed protein product [Arctia plantaginis]|uniref:Uncharacterized protein n=1 Tax=Arctia plantaginis TaxID=874455 RepID=A0A8S1A2L2_ARCPL|nr:unnamed protein product [Arctia plantaginis]
MISTPGCSLRQHLDRYPQLALDIPRYRGGACACHARVMEAGVGRGSGSLLAVACKCVRRLRQRNLGRCHRGPTIVSEQKQVKLRARLSGTCTRKN